MKIENLKQTIANNYIHHNQQIQHHQRTEQYVSQRPEYSTSNKNKIRIPENYESYRMNLSRSITREEQEFFESLYPAHKAKIKAYLAQSNQTAPVKGQFIDIRR